MADLKAGKKRNDGSSSHQSIGLDDEEDDIVIENGRATVPKDNQHMMGSKWAKERASRDAMATKMSFTWMGLFSVRENKKEEIYKLMLDAQKEMMLGPEEGEEKVKNWEGEDQFEKERDGDEMGAREGQDIWRD